MQQEKKKRNEFLANTNLEIQQQKNSDILSILVPKFVKDHFDKSKTPFQLSIESHCFHQNHSEGNALNGEQYEVGVLFCYIYQFDAIVNAEQKNIVHILDYIFREFDNICLSNGVQKIEVTYSLN